MPITVSLIVPFTFATEGEYHVSLDSKMASVDIKYIRNDEKVNEIKSIRTLGDSKLFPDDPAGTVNISKIVIKFHDLNQEDVEDEMEQPRGVGDLMKEYCIEYLNRLIEVIRFTTHRYWIRRISGFYLDIYDIQMINQEGKGKSVFLMAPPQGYLFPIPTKSEEDVKETINDKLVNETFIPVEEDLILDSLQFYSYGQFSESIIVANIALEVFIARKIFTDLINQGLSYEEAEKISDKISSKGVEDGMKYFFFQRFKNNKNKYDQNMLGSDPIWMSILSIRKDRRRVIHPTIGRTNPERTMESLQKIFTLVGWLNSICYYHIKS